LRVLSLSASLRGARAVLYTVRHQVKRSSVASASTKSFCTFLRLQDGAQTANYVSMLITACTACMPCTAHR
jgi:hypothetical protein